MNKLLTALALLTVSAGAAVAQSGNIHGSESRGEPINSSYRASGVDPATGYTPGRTATSRYVSKKKKRVQGYTTGAGRRY